MDLFALAFLFFALRPPSALRPCAPHGPRERLPRLMLSAWVAHKRPAGAPQLTYGRTVAKAMDTFDLDPARWPASSPRTAERGARCCAVWRGAAGLPAGAAAAGADADVA